MVLLALAIKMGTRKSHLKNMFICLMMYLLTILLPGHWNGCYVNDLFQCFLQFIWIFAPFSLSIVIKQCVKNCQNLKIWNMSAKWADDCWTDKKRKNSYWYVGLLVIEDKNLQNVGFFENPKEFFFGSFCTKMKGCEIRCHHQNLFVL